MKNIISAVILFCSVVSFDVRTASAASKFQQVNISPATNFVSALYRDLLGRSPSAAELKSVKSFLSKNGTRIEAARAVIGSTEYRAAFIRTLFKDLLGRDADQGSLSGFLEFYAQSKSAREIRAAILSSDEYFQTRSGGSNTTFVQSLFSDLLGREPAPAELTTLVQFLNRSNPRSEVISELLSSKEYREKFTEGVYQRYLGRKPSPGETSFFETFFANGGSEESSGEQILGSAEYLSLRTRGFFAKNLFSGIVGTFTGGANASPGDFTALIQWGDGSRSKGTVEAAGDGSFAVLGSHRYRAGGSFTLIITVSGKAKIRSVGRIEIRDRVTEFPSSAPGAKSPVRVAAGDVNGDGIDDIIAGALPGGSPAVNIFDGMTGRLTRRLAAFETSFQGGVFVAAGDVNGDGKADIVTGAGAGGPPQVKVFNGEDSSLLMSFFAYDTSFTGGVSVAAGDLNGDGRADIVTGSGEGAPAHVKVFDAVTGEAVRSFFAYDPSFSGGVHVAAGDVNGDGTADLVTGAGPGGGPHVRVFDGASSAELYSFFAFPSTFKGGVRVAAGDVNGDGRADIVTGAGPGGGPHVKVFDGTGIGLIRSYFAFPASFGGGVYAAAGDVHGTGTPAVVAGASSDGSGKISIKDF